MNGVFGLSLEYMSMGDAVGGRPLPYKTEYMLNR